MENFQQKEIQATLASQEIYLKFLRKRDRILSVYDLGKDISFHRNKPCGGLLSHPALAEVNKAIHEELEFLLANNLYSDCN